MSWQEKNSKPFGGLLRSPETAIRRPQLVKSSYARYFSLSLHGGIYASRFFFRSLADRNLFDGGRDLAQQAASRRDPGAIRSVARWVLAQTSGQRMDGGSPFRFARANRLSARLSAGS